MKRVLVALALALSATAAGADAAVAQGAVALGRPLVPALDSLLAAGRLQEAAWIARAAGDTAQAEQILARLEAVLRTPPRQARPLGLDSQGVSYTFRLDHGGGIHSIFKVDGSDIFCPACGAEREVAVYRIDRLLGADLTPMTVFQRIVVDGDTLSGSAMYFVAGTRAGGTAATKPDRLRLFDAIIGNSDRHGGNWLVREDGSVVAIDHNRTFEYRPGTRPKTCWETEIDSLRDPGDPGPLFERYRRLPADSLRAVVAGLLDPAEVEAFVGMRDPIVERVESRAARPDAALPRQSCPSEPDESREPDEPAAKPGRRGSQSRPSRRSTVARNSETV